MTEWQLIETAPKDGREILIYGYWEGELHDTNDWPSIYHAYLDDDCYYIVGCEYYGARVKCPTHWMPLPELPKPI